jgi:hypothetical protein
MLRRIAFPAVVLAAAVTPAEAPHAAGETAPEPASVRLVDCSPDEGAAAFYGRMKSVEQGDRMSMRFTLYERHLDHFEPLRTPALLRWHRAKPGVGAFGYRQALRGLVAGRTYRVQVSFRWHSADGELVERAQRRSAACRQFQQLPNLTSTLVGAEQTKVPGVLRYVMRVSNSGVAEAADVDVRMSVDGAIVDTVTVESLAPGEGEEVAVRGPECMTSVETRADPDGVIVESSEDDNGHALPCAEVPRI